MYDQFPAHWLALLVLHNRINRLDTAGWIRRTHLKWKMWVFFLSNMHWLRNVTPWKSERFTVVILKLSIVQVQWEADKVERGLMCHCAPGPLFLFTYGILLKPQGNSLSVESGFRNLMSVCLKVDFVAVQITELSRAGVLKVRMCHWNFTWRKWNPPGKKKRSTKSFLVCLSVVKEMETDFVHSLKWFVFEKVVWWAEFNHLLIMRGNCCYPRCLLEPLNISGMLDYISADTVETAVHICCMGFILYIFKPYNYLILFILYVPLLNM